MLLYVNHTRHSAIVTVKINSAVDLKSAVKIGTANPQVFSSTVLGYNDLVVHAGEGLELAEGVDAAFVAVRSGD